MRKVRVKVNELESADVQFVSLVSAGANRTPFKILKREGDKGDEMLDFGKLNVFKDSAPFKPFVAEVRIAKSSKDVDAALARVLAAGFSIADKSENESEFIYSQVKKDELPNGSDLKVVCVKSAEDIALIVVTAKAYAPNWAGTDFEEMAAQQAVFPGIGTALDTFRTVIANAIYDADDHAAAVKAVAKITKEFGAHVNALVAAIPSNAFKIEDMRAPQVAKHEWLLASAPSRVAAKAQAEKDAATKAAEAEAAKATPTAKSEAQPPAAPDHSKTNGKGVEANDENGHTHDSAKFVETAEGLVRKAVEPVIEALKGVTDALAKMNGRVDGLAESVAKAEDGNKRLAKRLPLADAVETDEIATKGEAEEFENEIPLLDTGFAKYEPQRAAR